MKRFVSLLLACCLFLGICAAGENMPEESLPEVPETAAEGPEEAADSSEDGEAVPVEEEGDEGVPEPLDADVDENGEAVPVDGDVNPENLPDEEELEEEIVDARVLQYGDEGDDVLELQTRLADLKYYTGNLSGRYREGTREAVKTFQGEYGLEKTGIADLDTQSRLFSARYRTLRYGASGDVVKKLQTRLMELGYYKGKISGNYLGGTQKSVRDFQEKNGLSVTGAADPLTQEALYSLRAVGNGDSPDATRTPVPDLSGYLVDDDDTAARNGVVMPDSYIPFTKTLKSGSGGSLVKQLQQRLTDLGYYTGPVSGNFAKQTLRAVKAVQTQNGIKVSGVVDEETWDVIFNDTHIVMPDATPKPSPTPEPVPFAMTVDVTNQVTTVYGRDENGEYTVPVRRMLCSSGTKANPSDVGDWVLNGRHAKWCVFPTWGNSYARYWTRINASIAFHSVIYTAVSLDAMKTSSYKALGSRASHGCVRLTVEDAKWVYENIGAGTVVSIREDLPADPELREALKLPPLRKGTSIPVETPVPTPVPEYDASKVPDIGSRHLKKNSQGPEVYWMQNRLTELGYYTGYAGGVVLNGTINAVKKFQRDNGFYASGTADQRTLNAMVLRPEETETEVPAETGELEITEEVEENVDLDASAPVITVIPPEAAQPTPTPGPENV
ncbi:MAG: peptidoglycan-binding protein [Clostridiales bacterium]|nr:peptidoglycan-binding protein [Clostridiales bacterium]